MTQEQQEALRNGIEAIRVSKTFDMHDYFEAFEAIDRSPGSEHQVVACGAPMCMAGHILVANGVTSSMFPLQEAAKLIGLDADDANELFAPDDSTRRSRYTCKRFEAVTILEHLLATGVVDWSVADPAFAEYGP